MAVSNSKFKDKAVLVTGAGKGIGREIALQFGLQKAKVVVADINLGDADAVAGEIASGRGKAVAVKCDVSSKGEVKRLFERLLKEFGRLDVLVNNAGIYPFGKFTDMTEEQWDKVIGVNLKGAFLCSQEAANIMIKQGKGGKIVSISSIASIIGYENLVHYCASKGGINGMTRALALELAPHKINVNAVLPGPIRTPGVGAVDEKTVAAIVSTIPWGRIGEPIDITNAVLFLASGKADFITGQTLVVDGGTTAR